MKLFVYRDGNKLRRVTDAHLEAERVNYAEGSQERSNIDLLLTIDIGQMVSLKSGEVTYTRVNENASDDEIQSAVMASIEAETARG